MNATIIYTELCRNIVLLESTVTDIVLENIMKGEMGLYKLRNMLLCRFCRKISKDYLCSKFCQHLICNICYDEGVYCSYGCKWCRKKDDFIPDRQTSLLVEMFKQLCAILKDVITGAISSTGSSELKSTLLNFVTDGLNTVASSSLAEKTCEEGPKTLYQKFIHSEKNSSSKKLVESSCQTEEVQLPKCDCGGIKTLDNLSDDPIAITPAESSDCKSKAKNSCNMTVQPFDNVSSTVPDKSPVRTVVPDKNQIKKRKSLNTAEDSKAIKYFNGELHVETEPKLNNEVLKNESILSNDSYFEPLPNLSLKNVRQKQNIFEKYGLALSPSQSKINHINWSDENARENRSINSENNKEPKYMPLKLKMKKINSKNSDESTYLVYNYTHKNENSDNDFENVQNNRTDRKVKRKATFISDYSIFSDDSDFETFEPSRKHKTSSKTERDICGCGSGGKVKYFTDICKRSRCPCFAQKRACVNCKCKFCSNPFVVEEVEEEIVYSESSDNESSVIDDENTNVHRSRTDNSEFVDVEGV